MSSMYNVSCVEFSCNQFHTIFGIRFVPVCLDIEMFGFGRLCSELQMLNVEINLF